MEHRCSTFSFPAACSLLPLGAQHVDDRLEGEPVGDLLSLAQHLAELGPRELHHLDALLLGLVGGDVVAVRVADQVERRNRLPCQRGGLVSRLYDTHVYISTRAHACTHTHTYTHVYTDIYT